MPKAKGPSPQFHIGDRQSLVPVCRSTEPIIPRTIRPENRYVISGLRWSADVPALATIRGMGITDILFGRPLATSEERADKIGPPGIPVFGLDALSSAAYGPEAPLILLIPLGL